MMSSENLKQVNQEIYLYWCEVKDKVLRKRLNKKRVGTFNRPNGRRKQTLKKVWRYNNGIRSHEIKRPSIGYKRAKEHRFRRAADGLLFKSVVCLKDLEKKILPYEVFMIQSKVSAYKRKVILEKAKQKNLPLYIQKPKIQ